MEGLIVKSIQKYNQPKEEVNLIVSSLKSEMRRRELLRGVIYPQIEIYE